MKNVIKLFTVLLLTVFTVQIGYAGTVMLKGDKPAGAQFCTMGGSCGTNYLVQTSVDGIPNNYNIRLYSDKLFQSYVSDIILHEVDSSDLINNKKAAAYAADTEDEKINDTAAYQNRKDGSIVILRRTN